MSLHLLLAGLLLASSPVAAQIATANPELQRAQKYLEDLKYADAVKALDAAWSTPGNGLQTVLEILKLQAVTAATLGQQDRARVLFRTLIYLAPDFTLPEADLGPRVLALYFEAKGRVSVEGALRVEAGPAQKGLRAVHAVSVNVHDPQRLVKRVRFHTRLEGAGWKAQLAPLEGSRAALAVDASSIAWWAELLGENERVLGAIGTAVAPLTAAVAQPAAPAQPEVAVSAGTNLKPAAYVLAGTGALAAIAGLVFGIRSNNWKKQIEGADRDMNGVVIGITREKALSSNAELRTSATIANTLFITAAALAGTGIALYVLSPGMQVTATPAGVALAGALP